MEMHTYGGQPQPMRLDNSRIWFACLTPFLGLIAEVFYADEFWLGALVWACAVIAMYAACAADRKYLISVNCVPPKGSSLVFPPLYIYRRTKHTGMGNVSFWVMVLLLIYAISGNGFVRGASMDETDKIEQVSLNYPFNIVTLEDSSSMTTIEDCLKEYLDSDEIEWTLDEEDSSGSELTVTAKCEDKDFEIVFSMTFDGYAFSQIEAESCTEKGKTYEGKKLEKKLSEIFDAKNGEDGGGKNSDSKSKDGKKDESGDSSNDSYVSA